MRARRQRPVVLGLDLLRPQRILFLGRQHAMRRQTLNRKRARNPDFASVLIGPVDEIFDLGIARDRGIDLFLPFAPRVPPLRVQLAGFGWPIVLGLPRHLPLFPRLVEHLVQPVEQRPKYLLPFVPNNIDFSVAGNVAQLDVRHAVIDETLPDGVAKRPVLRRFASKLCLLSSAFLAILKQIGWITASHEPLTSKS